jgi:serine/threonine protein kinase
MNAQATCLSAQELADFLEGNLTAGRQASMDEHISTCVSCTKALQEIAGDAAWWSDVEVALRSDVASHASIEHRVATSHGDVDTVDEPLCARSILETLGPTDDPDMLGRIGAYEIVGLIGQGGMGAVFKAFDAGLNRYVAIKILLPHLAASGAARERFRREGQAAAAVVNDHVLPIYVVDQWQGTPYLVMQYVRGSTLQQRLSAEGPFVVHDVLRIGLHVARGLEAAHLQGLVHRDVKPSNILLDGGVGRAIISDFGLARAADDASLTRSGMLAGTPQFMSPEQIRGERLDQRSDLFSLGSVLYAMCTGHPPFRAESSYAVMRRITDDTPRSIREINPNIPDWLERLVGKLMAKRVDQRPQSAADVANLLQQCMAHLEQPHSVSLPSELQDTQVTLSLKSMRRIIMFVSTSAMAAILAWAGFVFIVDEPTQTRSGKQTKKSTQLSTAGSSSSAGGSSSGDTQAGSQLSIAGSSSSAGGSSSGDTQAGSNDSNAAKMKGSTTVAGYKISLEGVGELGDISERSIRFRPNMNTQTASQNASNFSSDQFSSGQSFNNGNGTGGASGGFGTTSAGGGGGGFTGGGGAGFGHTFIKPTYGIALKITEEGAKGKRDKSRYVQLGSAAKIVELDGSTAEAEDSGPITATWPKFDKQFPGTFGLYVPRSKGIDVPVKEIHGELKITTGRRLEAVFAGGKPQKRKVDGEEFVVKSVDESPEGLTVVVSFPPTTAMKEASNIFERMQVMMTSMNCYELEIEDKDGNVLIPSGSSSSGSGGGSTQGFSFNGNNQKRTQSSEPELSTIAFRFKPMKSYAIKNIVARVVERVGEPETVPFTIEVQSE